MNYSLEPGDLIRRTGQPAIGILIKRVVAPSGHASWHYVLRSPNLGSWKTQVGTYCIDENTIYRYLDEGKIEVRHGSLKDRTLRE
jgi:hypothetical protein